MAKNNGNGNSDSGRMRVPFGPVDGSGPVGVWTTPLRNQAQRGGFSVLDDFSSQDAGVSSVQSATLVRPRVLADAMDVGANDGTLDVEGDEDMGVHQSVNMENEFQRGPVSQTPYILHGAGSTTLLPVPVNSGTRGRAVLQEITLQQFEEHDCSDIEEEDEDSEEQVNLAYQLEERIRQNEGPKEEISQWVASMHAENGLRNAFESGGFYDFEIYYEP